MVKHLLLLIVALFSFSSVTVAADPVWKQEGKCLFVELADGGVDAYELSSTTYSIRGAETAARSYLG